MKDDILIFTTKRLAVRRFVQRDAELLYAYSREPENHDLPNDMFDSIEEARRRLDIVIGNYRMPHYPLRYAVVRKEGMELIGNIAFKRMEDYNIQLNVMIASKYQNRGYGAEVMRGAVEYGKKALALEEVYALMKTENAQARAAFEQAGFQMVGEYETDWYGERCPVCKYKA
ncbi:MAG: GNAT family N-acetyltransferase [Lachnospiraceae bacterium]|nr:GNAT family N-acetyltransferase [Lachnospiraceae bacterium]